MGSHFSKISYKNQKLAKQKGRKKNKLSRHNNRQAIQMSLILLVKQKPTFLRNKSTLPMKDFYYCTGSSTLFTVWAATWDILRPERVRNWKYKMVNKVTTIWNMDWFWKHEKGRKMSAVEQLWEDCVTALERWKLVSYLGFIRPPLSPLHLVTRMQSNWTRECMISPVIYTPALHTHTHTKHWQLLHTLTWKFYT